MAVQFGEKKYQQKEGESDQDGYVYCAIYNIQYIYIYIKYIDIYKKYIYIKYIYIYIYITKQNFCIIKIC